MKYSGSIPPDLDQAADRLAGYIADPGQKAGPWPTRFQDVGVGEVPFVLRALLRQSLLYETLQGRLLLEWSQCSNPQQQARLIRQLHATSTQLRDTLGAVYRVQRDLGCGELPTILGRDLRLADAAPPASASALDRVQADDTAKQIYDAEFAKQVNDIVAPASAAIVETPITPAEVEAVQG